MDLLVLFFRFLRDSLAKGAFEMGFSESAFNVCDTTDGGGEVVKSMMSGEDIGVGRPYANLGTIPKLY